MLHSNITSYPARDRASNFGTGRSKRMQKESSKFGTGMSWEEDEEKQKRMHKLVDEYNDEVGQSGRSNSCASFEPPLPPPVEPKAFCQKPFVISAY